jgi:hypothetical protein
MNEVFPQVRTVLLAEATPGSILRIPRFEASMIAIVTDHSIDGTRSVVLLNAHIPNLPSVVFAQKWRLIEPYLCYSGKIRFEMGMNTDEMDELGHEWWQTPGVIVSIGDQLFIRAAPSEFGFRHTLINIQTGAIFAGDPPNSLFTFGNWKLSVRDDTAERSFELCSFKAVKRKAS